MGYKLKRILIYPDGVTEKQVYPKYWDYNFVGKTISEIQSDGWTGDNMSYYGTDTYGLYGNRAGGILHNFPISLASASKVTFTVNGRIGTSGTQNHLVGLATVATGGGWSDHKLTGFYTSYNSYGKFAILGANGNAFTNTTISGTNFAYTGVIDFTNKKITIQFTQGSSNSFNQTLTDAQITTIRTASYVNVGLSDTNTPRLSYLKLLVE